MKRKKKTKDMDVKVVTTTTPIIDSISDSDCDCECDTCNCHNNKYGGIDPFEVIQKDIDTYRVANTLRYFEDDALSANSKLKENGYTLSMDDDTETPGIRSKGDPKYAAFIPASAVGINYKNGDIIDAGAMIVNTLDFGPCYAVPGNNCTEVLSPVVTPTYIGNVQQPYGLYIPFNKKSLCDGLILASKALDYIENVGEDQATRLGCVISGIEPIDQITNSLEESDDESSSNVDEIEW